MRRVPWCLGWVSGRVVLCASSPHGPSRLGVMLHNLGGLRPGSRDYECCMGVPLLGMPCSCPGFPLLARGVFRAPGVAATGLGGDGRCRWRDPRASVCTCGCLCAPPPRAHVCALLFCRPIILFRPVGLAWPVLLACCPVVLLSRCPVVPSSRCPVIRLVCNPRGLQFCYPVVPLSRGPFILLLCNPVVPSSRYPVVPLFCCPG